MVPDESRRCEVASGGERGQAVTVGEKGFREHHLKDYSSGMLNGTMFI